VHVILCEDRGRIWRNVRNHINDYNIDFDNSLSIL
jgi:hypothetical protein